MKYTLYTLICIVKGWNLSMDEFKPVGKILWWIPMFLNNILSVLFKFLMFPFIWLGIYIFENNKRLIFRFFVYWKESMKDFSKIIEWETN